MKTVHDSVNCDIINCSSQRMKKICQRAPLLFESQLTLRHHDVLISSEAESSQIVTMAISLFGCADKGHDLTLQCSIVGYTN